MESYLKGLDDYFASHYSDYVKIAAIEGYEMPELLDIGKDGNIARRDSSCMLIARQRNAEAVLAAFKAGLTDTDFTFSFRFPKLHERIYDLFHPKARFCRRMREALAHTQETAEVGEKLEIEPRFWKKIVKGQLYPEKNTILALALVSRMQQEDLFALLEAADFSLDRTSVRDIVVEYLVVQKIFNEEMRDACLAEYHIVNLPIRREHTV